MSAGTLLDVYFGIKGALQCLIWCPLQSVISLGIALPVNHPIIDSKIWQRRGIEIQCATRLEIAIWKQSKDNKCCRLVCKIKALKNVCSGDRSDNT